MNTKGLGKFNFSDVAKGFQAVIVASVLATLLGVVQTPDFDVFSVDWHHVLNLVINAAVIAFTSHMGRIMLTNDNAQFAGGIFSKK